MTSLLCISPIDGRYYKITKDLNIYFSEFAFIKYRLKVEIKYLIELSKINIIKLSFNDINFLNSIIDNFTIEECGKVKDYEKITNHDVKSIEYYIKDKLIEKNFDSTVINHIHFGLTSQDVNSTGNILTLCDGLNNVIIPKINELIIKLLRFTEYKNKLLSKTHGQSASLTSIDKEFNVFIERITNQIDILKKNQYSTKFGGAVGNLSAHKFCYPDVDWEDFSDNFIKTFGLIRNKYTTQIDHYDNYTFIFDTIKRLSVILIDLCQDMWLYISRGVFKLQIIKDEVGSSTMPHKVNPIQFENAEGNLHITIGLIEAITRKLPISRLQRDLSDSTILRNIGVLNSYFYIAINSIITGLNKLEPNFTKINQEIEENYVIAAENIQCYMKILGVNNSYELLKELTRKEDVKREEIVIFINKLNISIKHKKKLLELI